MIRLSVADTLCGKEICKYRVFEAQNAGLKPNQDADSNDNRERKRRKDLKSGFGDFGRACCHVVNYLFLHLGGFGVDKRLVVARNPVVLDAVQEIGPSTRSAQDTMLALASLRWVYGIK